MEKLKLSGGRVATHTKQEVTRLSRTERTTVVPVQRELPRAGLESLNPKSIGKHVVGAMSPGALWGTKTDPSRIERQLAHAHASLERIATQIRECANGLQKEWKRGSCDLRADVITELSQCDELAPKLHRSLELYARKIARLERQLERATTPAQASRIEKAIEKLSAAAAKKAGKEGAELELLEVLEKQLGREDRPGSLNSLRSSWFSAWMEYMTLASLLQRTTEAKKDQARDDRQRDEIAAEFLRRTELKIGILKSLVAAAERKAR